MTEITVHGAGIFGLAVGWACLRRGARVRIIDPAGVGAGSSGGLVGALAPHVPENWNDKKAFQLDSLLMAESYWAEVAEMSGRDPSYARTGRLQPIADDGALALAHARAESAKALWQGRARWDVVHAGDDWAPQSPSGWLIHDTLTARLHPQQACTALAGAIRAQGGEICAEGPAQGIEVWATGWRGFDALNAHFGRQVGNGVKGQAALLELDRRALPQLFADGVHIVPHGDGTVAIGSTSEREFDDPTSTDVGLDAVLERARAAVPALKSAPLLARWAGVRPRARSRAPMLGAHPLEPGAYIANGGFKIGFGMAPMVGEVMAKLILEGTDDIPPGFKPEASLPGAG